MSASSDPGRLHFALVWGRRNVPAHSLGPLSPLGRPPLLSVSSPPPSVSLTAAYSIFEAILFSLTSLSGPSFARCPSIPPLNGVRLLVDLFGMDVALRHQLAPGLQEPADPLPIGLHGAHEVFQFFYGGISSLECPRHLRVRQNIFLCGRGGGKLTSHSTIQPLTRDLSKGHI